MKLSIPLSTCRNPKHIQRQFIRVLQHDNAQIAEKKHEHHGRTSRGFLDSEKVLKGIRVKTGDKFPDLGSGEGYFSIAASQFVGKDGGSFMSSTLIGSPSPDYKMRSRRRN